MKHGSNPRRGRSRGNGKRGPSSQKSNNFESNGPDVKVRGTAQQVQEKYLALARDAFSSGDRIAAEGFFQFAEHYYRVAHADHEGGPQNGQDGGGARQIRRERGRKGTEVSGAPQETSAEKSEESAESGTATEAESASDAENEIEVASA